jgi:proteasome accessory factor A
VPCFGLETEFSAYVPGCGKLESARDKALRRFESAVARRLVHLPCRTSSGIMTEYGRSYIDAGGHPEFATIEADSPDGTLEALRVAREVFSEAAVETGIELFAGNLDYRGHFWGTHENYCVRTSLESTYEQLLPHLVSRSILTGAGGLVPASPAIEFTLSPRAWATQLYRGLCLVDREPLAEPGYSRAHITCGESNLSEISNWIKLGSTAALLCLIEADSGLGTSLAIKRPVEALRVLASDPLGCVKVEAGNARFSALEIQRRLLASVREHVEATFMPTWTADLCARWAALLGLVEQGPDVVGAHLDWAIKLLLFRQHLKSRGVKVRSLPLINQVIRSVYQLLPRHRQEGRLSISEFGQVIDRNFAENNKITALRDLLAAGGLAWSDIRRALCAREELCEIDVRYGSLAPPGLFQQLHASGALKHCVKNHTGLQPLGRVAARNVSLLRLSRVQGAWADWDQVGNGRGRVLLLDDPYAKRFEWKRERLPPHISHATSNLHEQALLAFRAGKYETASRLLRRRSRRTMASRETSRLFAWNEARRGFLPVALRTLDKVHGPGDLTLMAVTDYLHVLLLGGGLRPSPDMAPWIERGRALIERTPEGFYGPLFFEYVAGFERAYGSPEHARELYQKARELESVHQDEDRIQARIAVGLAECARRLGRPGEAHRQLERAKQLQVTAGWLGDYVNLTLPVAAKLAPERSSARRYLHEARARQRGESRLGLARVLLLQARLCPDRRTVPLLRQILLRLRRQLPALHSCPLLARIVDRQWDAWTSGVNNPGEDLCWGV